MATKNQGRGFVVDFSLSAVATSAACIFSNPMEVCKTRFQLQGELKKVANVPYRNVFQAFTTIAKDEGISAFYKGFQAAIMYQVVMNGIRLSLYPVFKQTYSDKMNNNNYNNAFLCNLSAGMTSGAIGAFFGSPFFLVKIRQQVQNSCIEHAVGYQHNITSVHQGLYSAYKESNSIKGLFRGADAQIARVCIGGGIQVSTYDYFKNIAEEQFHIDPNGLAIRSISGLFSGITVAIGMNPMDTIASRLYNQPVDPVTHRGLYYNGTFDTLKKIIISEGILSLWKGVTAHAARIIPHTVLTFIFWEQASLLYNEYNE